VIEDKAAIVYPDPARSWIAVAPIRFVVTLSLLMLVYGFSLYFVDFDVGRLWGGLPRLAHWAAKAWPPDLRELDVLSERAIETVAMAVVGTTIGTFIAAPCCILAAQNITPSPFLYTPIRWFLNILRGIDSFIFALLLKSRTSFNLGPGTLKSSRRRASISNQNSLCDSIFEIRPYLWIRCPTARYTSS